MKVDPSKVRGPSVSGTDATKSQKLGGLGGKATDNKKANVNGDFAKVEISPKAQMANKVRELATPDMDRVDEARVAHFQKLIDEGNYKVDSEALADKMISEHLIG